MKSTLAKILLKDDLRFEDIFPSGSATDSEGRPQPQQVDDIQR